MNIINFVHKRIIKYACRDIDELYKDFNISSSGYNKDEVKESIDRYGSVSYTHLTLPTKA